MGTSFKYKCNKCGYEVQTSGKHDYGMLSVVDVYTCKSCKIIADVCVGKYGRTYSKEDVVLEKNKSEIDLAFYTCPECGSGEHLVKWSKWKRPCPKCDGKMEKDSNGDRICWN